MVSGDGPVPGRDVRVGTRSVGFQRLLAPARSPELVCVVVDSGNVAGCLGLDVHLA